MKERPCTTVEVLGLGIIQGPLSSVNQENRGGEKWVYDERGGPAGYVPEQDDAVERVPARGRRVELLEDSR